MIKGKDPIFETESPTADQSGAAPPSHAQSHAQSHGQKSFKSRLLAGLATPLAPILIVGAIGLAVGWAFRGPILQAAIGQYLASNSVNADYSLSPGKNGGYDVAVAALGDRASPTLLLKTAHIDVTPNLFTRTIHLRVSEARGLSLALGYHDGKMDFGALGPLLPKPNAKPGLFSVAIDGLDIKDATFTLNTDSGRAFAHGDLSNDAGIIKFTGHLGADVGALSGFGIKAGTPQTLPIGLGYVPAKMGSPAIIGFNLLPQALNFAVGPTEGVDLTLSGLSGNILGQVSLGDELAFIVKPSTMNIAALSGAGVSGRNIGLSLDGMRLPQNEAAPNELESGSRIFLPNDAGFAPIGSIGGTITASSLSLPSGVSLADLNAPIHIERDRAGQIKLSGLAQVAHWSAANGKVSGQTMGVSLNSTGQSDNLADIKHLRLTGLISLAGSGINLSHFIPANAGLADFSRHLWRTDGHLKLSLADNIIKISPEGPRVPAIKAANNARSDMALHLSDNSQLLWPLAGGNGPTIIGNGDISGHIGNGAFIAPLRTIHIQNERTDILVDGATGHNLALAGLSVNFNAGHFALAAGTGRPLSVGARANLINISHRASPRAILGQNQIERLSGPISFEQNGANWRANGNLTIARAVRPDVSASNIRFSGILFGQNGQIRIVPSLHVGQLLLSRGQTAIEDLAISSVAPILLHGPHFNADNIDLGIARLVAREGRGHPLLSLTNLSSKGPISVNWSFEGGRTIINMVMAQNGRLGTIHTDSLDATNGRFNLVGHGQISITNAGINHREDIDFHIQSERLRAQDFLARDGDIEGNIRVTGQGSGLTISTLANQCVRVNLASASASFGEIDAIAARLCGQNGVLYSANGRGSAISGEAQLGDIVLRMGQGASQQRLTLFDTRAHLGGKGGMAVALGAQRLQLSIPKAPEEGAPAGLGNDPQAAGDMVFFANQLNVDVVPTRHGVDLVGQMGQISSSGLPISLGGALAADLHAGANGLNGTIKIDRVTIDDNSGDPILGQFDLTGIGTLAANQLALTGQLTERQTGIKVADVALNHNLSNGQGGIEATNAGLTFEPASSSNRTGGLQPSHLSPRLLGIVSGTSGSLGADINLGWRPNMPLTSGGMFNLNNISFLTLAGPVGGVSGQISLSDLLKLSTDGPQQVSIASFNPGVPITRGQMRFAIGGAGGGDGGRDGIVHILDGVWPFAGGQLSILPTDIVPGAASIPLNVDLTGVDLNLFLRLTQIRDLQVSGTASGHFPIVITGGNADIVNGTLAVDDRGGILHYTGPDISPPPPPLTFWQRLTGQKQAQRQGVGLAIAALRNLNVRVLRLSVNGRLTGDIDVGIEIVGSNNDVLSGTPFRFNVRANAPLGRLMNLRRYLDPQYYYEVTRPQRAISGDTSGIVITPPAPQVAPPVPPVPQVAPPAPSVPTP